jgi:hypothetical protein
MQALFARLMAAWRPRQHTPKPHPTTLLLQLQSVGLGSGQWIERVRSVSRLYGDPSDGTVAMLRTHMPQVVAATLAAATEIQQHRFDLLGSGSYVPIDSKRPAQNGYIPIQLLETQHRFF